MKKTLALVSMLLLSTCATTAYAQQLCQPIGEIEKQLKDKFSEEVIFVAIASNNQLLKVWTNKTTGTWTLTITRINKNIFETCVMITGKDYTSNFKPKKPTI